MLPKLLIRIFVMWVIIVLAGFSSPAQEAPTVKAIDLQTSPQRYWATFFVFSDALREKPSLSSTTIDGRNVFPLKTAVAGTIYAEYEAAKTLSSLNEGEEHMFYATVTQRKGAMWGLLPFGRDFVVIVKSVGVMQSQPRATVAPVAPAETTSTATPPSGADRQEAILSMMDQVMKDVNKEMYGFAQAQGLELSEVMTSEQYRDRVGASIRNAVRKIEDQQRTTSYEFLINMIWAMMSEQNAGPATENPGYVPEADPSSGQPSSLEAEPSTAIEEQTAETAMPTEVDIVTEQEISTSVEQAIDVPVEAPAVETISDAAISEAVAPVDQIMEPSTEAATLPVEEIPALESIEPAEDVVPVEQPLETPAIEESAAESTIEEAEVVATPEAIQATVVAEDPAPVIEELVVETPIEQPVNSAPEIETEMASEPAVEIETEISPAPVVSEAPAVVAAEQIAEPVVEQAETIEPVPESVLIETAPVETPEEAFRTVPEPVPTEILNSNPAPAEQAPAPAAVDEPAPRKRIVPPLILDAPVPRRSK